MANSIVKAVRGNKLSKNDNDAVVLIERILAANLKVAKDVGVISYNETPLKKIILNGPTTISTDFQKMGESVSNIIIENKRRHEEIPFYLTIRSSF